MADHTGWFTWQGTIERREDGTWVVRGTLNRDLADYADWHGHPHGYDGDGTLQCPGSQCGKPAGFPLGGFHPDNWLPDLPGIFTPLETAADRGYDYLVPPGQNTRIVIPDEWMARLVLGGKASNPGFQMNFNAQEDYEFVVSDWSNLPTISYENLRCGDEYRLTERDVTPTYGLPPHWTP